MTFGAKALITVISLGGVGSAPLLLNQFSLGNSQDSTQSSTYLNQENTGNCLVTRELVDLESSLWYSSGGSVNLDTFVKVSCSNTNLDQGSKTFNHWSGLLPDVIIKDRQKVTTGRKIEIKTKTETIEDSISKYKTTFNGSHFYYPIEGEWTKIITDTGEKSIVEVKITSPEVPSEKIYLLFK